MRGIDVSKYQDPTSVPWANYDFGIIQASHGVLEEPLWRDHFNDCVHAGKSLGLYHFAESNDPRAEAQKFHDLVSFLQPAQVRMGFWLDSETGQSEQWVDAFRSAVQLPWIGLYSNLAGFNGPLKAYKHFSLNWLSEPDGVVVPAGWTIPDFVIRQTGFANDYDLDVTYPSQPYPEGLR